MPLTIHHLQFSQSERLPWLCEELNIPYNLVLHQRAPIFSPQSIKDLHPLGSAPIIQDTRNNDHDDGGSSSIITLAESAACVDYINHVHGSAALALLPTQRNYSDYLYWFHFANSTFQPQLVLLLSLSHLDPAMTSPPATRHLQRLKSILTLLDERLRKNTWLAGEEFTTADIMTVFSLTTMRAFWGYELAGYQGVLDYLGRVVKREAYVKARARADPGLEAMIGAEKPKSFGERLRAEGKI